jgi:hypothetical protein
MFRRAACSDISSVVETRKTRKLYVLAPLRRLAAAKFHLGDLVMASSFYPEDVVAVPAAGQEVGLFGLKWNWIGDESLSMYSHFLRPFLKVCTDSFEGRSPLISPY